MTSIDPVCNLCRLRQQDGFIHLTAEPDLLLEVANRFYCDSPGDWEVLVLDPAKLTSEVNSNVSLVVVLAAFHGD